MHHNATGDAPSPASGAQGPEDLGTEVLTRLERSVDWLRDSAREPAWVIHEVRKELKRVRALLRLAGERLPTRRLEKACAGTARRLSHLRDADALLETLQRLEARPDAAPAAAGLSAARAWVTDGRRGTGGLPPDVAEPVAAELEGIATKCRKLSFAAMDAEALDAGLARSRRRAAKAWQRLDRNPDPERFHDLRKKVKRELYQRELSGRPFDRMDRAMLKKLADVLGELQDLEVLRAALKPAGLWKGKLRSLARGARRELRQRAARLAAARYGEARP